MGDTTSGTSFDSPGYFEKLKAAGMPEMQAKVEPMPLREVMDERFVTKEYFDMRLKDFEYRLTIRLGGMVAASVAIVAALVKLT